MPKQKTKKAVSKRMRVTKNGKVLRRHMGTGHLLSAKSAKRRRKLKRVTTVKGANVATMRRLLNA